MGRWTDLAPWMGPTVNEGDGDGRPNEPEDRMYEVRGLVLHIAQGVWPGIVPWAKNPNADVSMHFAAGRNGERAQVVDTDIRAWTQADGNGHWLSVENEGFVPGALTAQQVEFCAQIFARGHQVYGYPLQLADTPSGKGLGYHAMGGASWGGHYDCPGPNIIAQRGAILARAVQIAGGAPAPAPGGAVLRRPWPSYMPQAQYFGLITGPNESHGGYYPAERADVKALQQRLIVLGYVPGVTNPASGWADGLFEQPTADAVARWQRAKYAAQTSRYGEVWSDDWARLFTY